MKPPASGSPNHQEQHGSHLQAPSSRCEHLILPFGFTILSSVSVTAFGVPLPSSVQPTSPLPLLLLSTVMTSPWGREASIRSSLSASFCFLTGTMTSSLPWKFHLPSCAPTSVPVLGGPIKRGSQFSISTEHSRVLKLLGSVSAPGKPLLRQDHEALRDCPLSPRARGCLLLSSALGTK